VAAAGVVEDAVPIWLHKLAVLDRFLAGDPESDCPPGMLAKLIAGRMLVRDDVDEIDRVAQ
jgi:hypothetical protein